MSLYNVSVPTFVRILTALSAILDKAATQAEARKIEPATLLNDRLAPDMFTFTRQVQNACDFAAKTTARLAGADVPDYANTETSFAQLKERIATVLKYVQGFKAEQFNGAETRVIKLPMGAPRWNYRASILRRLRSAQFLFSRHQLQHPASQRRRDRQATSSGGR